jgi:hypothetical protein
MEHAAHMFFGRLPTSVAHSALGQGVGCGLELSLSWASLLCISAPVSANRNTMLRCPLEERQFFVLVSSHVSAGPATPQDMAIKRLPAGDRRHFSVAVVFEGELTERFFVVASRGGQEKWRVHYAGSDPQKWHKVLC